MSLTQQYDKNNTSEQFFVDKVTWFNNNDNIFEKSEGLRVESFEDEEEKKQ